MAINGVIVPPEASTALKEPRGLRYAQDFNRLLIKNDLFQAFDGIARHVPASNCEVEQVANVSLIISASPQIFAARA